jgi:SAM-dependent methyltransferase
LNCCHRDMNSCSGEFYLDEDSEFEISGTPSGIIFPRWMKIAHCIDKRMSLILATGEELRIMDINDVQKDTKFYLRYGSVKSDISADRLVLEILFLEKKERCESAEVIATFPLEGGSRSPYWREAELDISYLRGRRGHLLVRCCSQSKKEPYGDRVAIADLCVAREDRLPLMRARSFRKLRFRNEIDRFNCIYRHSMYSQKQDHQAEIAKGQARPIRTFPEHLGPDPVHSMNHIDELEPIPSESPYDYGTRLLSANIPQKAPDFIERLKIKAGDESPVKILSLCCGAARIEADFASRFGPNVKWWLLDLNPDLLGIASKQFAPTLQLNLIVADANALIYSGEKWDIIICISALHHIVELERLIKFCHESLNENGEFWSIGEYVGRNGNQLWPDARNEADRVFKILPEKYRRNYWTGQVDPVIPENDYSVGCFEGIRSEDIEPILERWFIPLDVYRRNCFLWRLLNMAYSDNYDIKSREDRQWIVRLVEAELNHFRDGGHGTELFGVYRPRSIR